MHKFIYDSTGGESGDCYLFFPFFSFFNFCDLLVDKYVVRILNFFFLALSTCDPLKYVQGIIQIEPCGVLYWVVSSLQIPLALIFTAWILRKKESNQHQTSNDKVIAKN